MCALALRGFSLSNSGRRVKRFRVSGLFDAATFGSAGLHGDARIHIDPSCSECLECALRLPFGFLALSKLAICRSHEGRRRLFHLVGKLYETLRAHFGRRGNESWRFKN